MRKVMGGGPEDRRGERPRGNRSVPTSQIERALEELFDLGVLELHRLDPKRQDPSIVEISPEAKAIGEQVRAKVLSRLGLSTLGGFVAHARDARGLRVRDVARETKLSSEAVTQLETGRMEFFYLSPSRAADLIELLGLDPQIVLRYLRSPSSGQPLREVSARFFRTDKTATEAERLALSKRAMTEAEGQGHAERLAEFLPAFLREITQRGLLDDGPSPSPGPR